MREYYLFHIKQNIYDLYYLDSYILYKNLETVFKLKEKDLNYGFSIYRQLCISFDIKILKKFLNRKFLHHVKNKNNTYTIINNYVKEKTIVKLGFSRITIKSNVSLPPILKMFSFYNQKIFVCDFKNKDFFWLNELM